MARSSQEVIREEAAAFARAVFTDGPRWVVFRLQGGQLRWKRCNNTTVADAWRKYLVRNADKYDIRRGVNIAPVVWTQNFHPELDQERES